MTEDIKQMLTEQKQRGHNEPRWEYGLSTGYIILNLACSGRPDVGFAPDNYYCWCGTSGSGKTVITLAALAEASISSTFDKHRLIYDGTENGALMRIDNIYGERLAQRLEPPDGTKEKPKYSSTLEGFYHNVITALDKGPCIYLLDSMEPLPTEQELKDFMKIHRKRKKPKREEGEEGGQEQKKEPGSYGTERARVNSKHLRIVYNKLEGSSSFVIVIFQSRSNIGPMAMFNPHTRGGGNAPTFYAGIELLSNVSSHLKVKEKLSGKYVEQGVVCKVRVKKGRIQGKDRTVMVPIYHSGDAPGIDEVGGCVDFMAEWNRWPKTGKEFDVNDGKIDAVDFKIEATREKVIQYILNNNLEEDLRNIVVDTWNDIEESCSVVRKHKYK